MYSGFSRVYSILINLKPQAWMELLILIIDWCRNWSKPSSQCLQLALRILTLHSWNLQSIRQIVVSLNAAIPAMLNAFVLVLLVSAIYAILSVRFFGKVQPEHFAK